MMSKKIILTILLIPVCIWYRAYGINTSSNVDTLQMQAMMLVHADITNFSINDEQENFKEILQLYNCINLKVRGINDCSVFKITTTSPCCKCDFIIAYNFNDKNFYRLSGFRVNEFSDFYNLVLLSGSVSNLKPSKPKRMLGYILNNVNIEGYDISKAYSAYYGKFKASIYDTSSCYRKSIIRAY